MMMNDTNTPDDRSDWIPLPMLDPCPHVTRLEMISAKLGDEDLLEELTEHIWHCNALASENATNAAIDNRS